MACGRIVSFEGGQDGQTPFFSANDRSRWITVRALVDKGTFELDSILATPDGRQWDTIDKVQHVGADGRLHFYSSKPPLLTMMAAGVYWSLKQSIGWEIADQTDWVVRTTLLAINGAGWMMFLIFAALLINSLPVRDWTRYFVLACGCFGTLLSPFLITLNNHLAGAICVMVSLYCVAEIVRRTLPSKALFLGAGLFAGTAVGFELPALAFGGMAMLICLWQDFRRGVLISFPAAALPIVLVGSLNWLAHGQWQPAYQMRGDGPLIAIVEGDWDDQLDAGLFPREWKSDLPFGFELTSPGVSPGDWPGTPTNQQRWVVRDKNSSRQLAIVKSRSDLASDEKSFAAVSWLNRLLGDAEQHQSLTGYQIRHWGNWYEYPGSYWLQSNHDKKSLVDRGEPAREVYAFQLLFGHHGIFSLTPIWVFSLAGMISMMLGVKLAGRYSCRWLGFVSLLTSVVVIAFYIMQPQINRNYGGYCCCPRWLLWMIPLWLVSMMPVVDWLAASRWGKFSCFVALLIGIINATIPANNPWVLPWMYDFWGY